MNIPEILAVAETLERHGRTYDGQQAVYFRDLVKRLRAAVPPMDKAPEANLTPESQDAAAVEEDRAPEAVRFAGNLAPMMNRPMCADEKVMNSPPTGQPVAFLNLDDYRHIAQVGDQSIGSFTLERDKQHTMPVHANPSPAVAEVAAALEAIASMPASGFRADTSNGELRALASRLRGAR